MDLEFQYKFFLDPSLCFFALCHWFSNYGLLSAVIALLGNLLDIQILSPSRPNESWILEVGPSGLWFSIALSDSAAQSSLMTAAPYPGSQSWPQIVITWCLCPASLTNGSFESFPVDSNVQPMLTTSATHHSTSMGHINDSECFQINVTGFQQSSFSPGHKG